MALTSFDGSFGRFALIYCLHVTSKLEEKRKMDQLEEEESQETGELDMEEGENKRVGKTWEETFSRSMEKLRGGR